MEKIEDLKRELEVGRPKLEEQEYFDYFDLLTSTPLLDLYLIIIFYIMRSIYLQMNK